MINIFIRDGVKNLSCASKLITKSMSDQDVEDAILQFAFGIERICKGIIFSVNPVFIYASFSYDQTIQEQYSEKLTESGAKRFENKKGNNTHVLAMYESVEKATHFSDSVSSHKSALLKLKHYRDILVHRSLDEFKHDKVRLWLLEIYYPVTKSIIHEQSIDELNIYQNKEYTLKEYSESSDYGESQKIKLAALLEKHKKMWNSKNNENLKLEAMRITKLELNQIRDIYDNGCTKHKCPACGQDSILESEVEVIGDEEDWQIDGPYAVELRCHYCSLRIGDFELLDYLDVDNWWKKNINCSET